LAVFEASETNEILPWTLPRDRGAKTPLNVKLSPLARVKGKSSPLIVKSLPFVMTWERVILESPQLAMVMARMLRRPIPTLPKRRFAGVRTKCSVLALGEVGLLSTALSARALSVDTTRRAKTTRDN
jgi:hypothetical protein